MKSILPIAGILAASIAAAPAASIVVNTVKTINGNGRTILEATGNSLNVTTFASEVGTAFDNNTGGVWNFDGAAFSVASGETITLNYGNLLSNSLVMTFSGNTIDQANVPGEATSGSFGMGLQTDGASRTFTLSTPLLTVGIFNTDRNDSGRLPVLKVTYQDTTTASTSGANADNTYFHGLSGTLANPIVSFSLEQNNFVRYDDLGFITVPEPSSALLLGLAGVGAFIRRRR
jgi:hypothetical protein